MNRLAFVLLAQGLFIVFGIINSCAVEKTNAPGFIIKDSITIYASSQPTEPIYKAIIALQRDLLKTTGCKSIVKNLSSIKEPGIILINEAEDKSFSTLLVTAESHRISLQYFKGKQNIVLQGADMRGTIYAIYTFSEKVLGVPPLWFYAEWRPILKKEIKVEPNLNIYFSTPHVKYRTWFPNDMDLLVPWTKLNKIYDEIWLETALRLKLNTIQNNGNDFVKKDEVDPTVKLASSYGFISTTHHHAPVDASFSEWDKYWKNIRKMEVPILSLANQDKVEEFWRYSIESVHKNGIDMLWVINFRGAGDLAFWRSFKDSPQSIIERGAVISAMMAKQRNMVIEITGDKNARFTTIFYDELSDLLSKGLINPPIDSNLIWTFVAARRDHYPAKDIQSIDPNQNYNLGYYLNLQFTSTGSHLVEGEGPWKMEQNFRYVQSKSQKPIQFSVVNAGNIREFLLSLSANANMMWDFKGYRTNSFLKSFCATYYGENLADKITKIYEDYFNAYWQQQGNNLKQIDRQFIFQDQRYRRAIDQICEVFNQPFTENPLRDYPNEQVLGRTFSIVPIDNGTTNQLDAMIKGSTKSAADFLRVAKATDKMLLMLNKSKRTFFKDNIRNPSYFMYHLNKCLLNLCLAYRTSKESIARAMLLQKSLQEMKSAKNVLMLSAHGDFKQWYDGERIFGLDYIIERIKTLK